MTDKEKRKKFVMDFKARQEKESSGWNLKLWLWVLLFTILIYSTIPLARSFQKIIYASVGKEFFTYSVLFVIIAGLISILYALLFKLRVKSISQYIWLIISGGMFIFFTIHLSHYPEEAVHLLEYGLLAYLVFKALSHRVRDWTVYISAVGLTAFIGTGDEFIQWLVPTRVWDYRDVQINAAAGAFFLIAISKGIRPEIISQPVKRYSVKILAGIITLNLVFLGFCLSVTPRTLDIYTSLCNSISWLQHEETMTEYGYLHSDKEIGAIYSRFMLEDLEKIDYQQGEDYGKLVYQYMHSKGEKKKLIKIYTPNTNPFLFEFLIHVLRRNKDFEEIPLIESIMEKNEKSNRAYRENLIVEKYFKTTLEHSGLKWPESRSESIQKASSLWEEEYTSTTGHVITMFSIKTVWIIITAMLAVVWISAGFWRKRLNDD